MDNDEEFYSTIFKESPDIDIQESPKDIDQEYPQDINNISLESLNKSILDRFDNKISPMYTKILNSPTNDILNVDLLKSIHDLKPLGLDAHLNEWIESQKNNPILINSPVASKEQLESDKSRLNEIVIEIGDKLLTILDNIPNQILSKLPGYDTNVHYRLKVFDQTVKARIRQSNRKLLNFEKQQINERLRNQNSITSVELTDDIRSISSKNSLARNKYINNNNMNNKIQPFDYAVTTLTQDQYFTNQTCAKNMNNNEDCNSQYFESPRYSSTILNNFSFNEYRNNATFQTKKPMVTESQKLMNTNYPETQGWNNSINSQIRSLPTSTITSQTLNSHEKSIDKSYFANHTSQNNMKNNINTEEIIKINPEDLFKTSIAWNDSEDENEPTDNFQQAIKNDIRVNGFPSQMDMKNKFGITFNDCNNSSSIVILSGNLENDGGSGQFDNLDFPHCRDMLSVFRSKFGLHQFRPNQLSAINAAILGYDCFVLMPTGGGKSLCYQLPALLTRGITIVISPLRSLIIDQIQKLASLDIPAMHLTADLNEDQVSRVYRKLYECLPDLKLLYLTPEKLSLSAKFSTSLVALYQRKMLARFVIDEVHCVSQWGHDFRPDYKKLDMLKKNFPDVPLIVLTATATPRVRSDILHQLHLESPIWFISSFNRPNLRYTVMAKKSKSSVQQIVDIIKAKFNNECGIVYCISRKDCDDIAEALYLNEINALSYHAGLDDKVRIDRQTQWISEKIKVICATIAFGMGIDKPNVRFVIHAAMPKSIEGYYQESGRAGRDGDTADCFLLYNYGDMHRYRNMMERNDYGNSEALKTHLDNLYKIVHYCENMTDCRRAIQLNYFGEKFDRQECISNSETTCDNCRTYDNFTNMDVTEDARALVELISSLDKIKSNNITVLQVVDIYKGSNVSNISYKLGYDYHTWFGRGQQMTKHEIERLLHNLVIEGYLCENMELKNGIVCAYVAPGRLANELLYQDNVQIFMQKKKIVGRTSEDPSMMQMSEVTNVVLKDLEQRCYSELFDIVNSIAGALDVSANSIMNLVALRVMSKQLPCNETAMLKIPHVTKANFVKYGNALLDVTKKYAREKRDLIEEEKLNQLEYTNFNYCNYESDSDWTNHAKKSRTNINKRNKKATNSAPKKLKTNDLHNYDGFPPRTNSCGGNNISKNASCNKSVNGTRGAKSYVSTKGDKSYNMPRGRKTCSGRGSVDTQSMFNHNGPGLCEFTKKYPIMNNQ